MKLRIRGNTVRFRLGRSEVERLAEAGDIEDSVQFGTGEGERLTYSLRTRNADGIAASYAQNRITIEVPQNMAAEWASGGDVGIEASVPIGDGDFLAILIEKDFACTSLRGGEDNADAFPNPSAMGEC